jgi:ADP-dependent NAD(P)H-hydrate dehydratase / NAD(P)H-hydrate epimerase
MGLKKENMRALPTRKMQALDRWAIRTIGIPSLCLMENAGRLVAEEVKKFLRRSRSRSRGREVLVIAGTGNNGGDGFVAARHLLNAGVRVKILLAGSPGRMTPDAALNFKVARKLKIPIKTGRVVSTSALLREFAKSDVIIDALFGTGLARAVDGEYRALIEAMNASRKPIIAIDIPSGLDGTTGRVWGAAVKARKTVTLAHSKRGFFINEGPRCTGRVVCVDIGIPKRSGC